MKVKTIRIPDDLEKAVDFVSSQEKIDKTQSFRKLIRVGFEYYLCQLYRDGRIGIRDLATMLDISLSESIDLLISMGIPGNIRTANVMDSLRSLGSAPDKK